MFRLFHSLLDGLGRLFDVHDRSLPQTPRGRNPNPDNVHTHVVGNIAD
jgi:hypothetical protein